MALYLGSEKISKVNVTKVAEGGGVILPTLKNPANASDLLNGEQLIGQNGKIVTGTMPNNGAISKVLDLDASSYSVPKGYTDGGEINIDESIQENVGIQANLIAQIVVALENKLAKQ